MDAFCAVYFAKNGLLAESCLMRLLYYWYQTVTT
ncbi:MAG: hypothetical protein ACJAS1_007515, partial [Oleiphilaceae bacterium]